MKKIYSKFWVFCEIRQLIFNSVKKFGLSIIVLSHILLQLARNLNNFEQLCGSKPISNISDFVLYLFNFPTLYPIKNN